MRKKVQEWLGVLSGFRKFAMASIYLVVAIVLVLFGVIPETDWLSNTKDVMVAFMATNVGEHILNTVKQYLGKK